MPEEDKARETKVCVNMNEVHTHTHMRAHVQYEKHLIKYGLQETIL